MGDFTGDILNNKYLPVPFSFYSVFPLCLLYIIFDKASEKMIKNIWEDFAEPKDGAEGKATNNDPVEASQMLAT